MINKIFIITTILFISLASAAQDLKSDAVYQELTKEYTLNKDGSWSYHHSYKLLINTYYAFHNLYGEDFILYDPAFQKLKVNRSVTTMADGKQVSSPANAFNEVLPGFAANVPAWNRLREMVVTHTGLERGATIDFDYTLTSAKGYTQAMMGNEQLLMNSPVKKLTFILNIPAGASVNFEQYNIEGKPSIVKSGGKTSYTWVITDLPAALREDFRPKEQQNRPRIVFVAGTKASDVLAGFASQDAFKPELNDELKKAASAAVSGINNPLLKTLKLQEKVANELNTWQIPLHYTGYKLRSISEIWQNNGGTDAEKALLLAAMLRSQNIQAEPVAVVAERYFTKKLASPALIERFLVKVSLQGLEPLFLSPVQADQQDLRYLLGGKRVISMVPGKSLPSEVIAETVNLLALSGNLDLNADLSLKGAMNLELGGRLNPWLKMQKDTAYSSTMLSNALGNAKITEVVQGKKDIDVSSFRFNVSATSFTSEKAGYVFLKFPAVPTGSDSWHMTELLSKRAEPIEIPFAINESYDIFITIPEGMKVVSLAADLNMNNEFGSIDCSVTTEGNRLHIERKISIARTYIPAEKYETFKMLMNSWNSKKYREVVLKREN
jgi:hypothetical protein